MSRSQIAAHESVNLSECTSYIIRKWLGELASFPPVNCHARYELIFCSYVVLYQDLWNTKGNGIRQYPRLAKATRSLYGSMDNLVFSM